MKEINNSRKWLCSKVMMDMKGDNINDGNGDKGRDNDSDKVMIVNGWK